MDKVFSLIDCNNFFVSCERLFRPDLEGKPVVVLSSNDGCVVARSNEAKQLGIPMGAPAFKYREIFERQGVARFSGNFELYGDISKRITALLTTITPRIEIYSVDESFLDLSQLAIHDFGEWGRAVRAEIFRQVGVPVSIGIAPTKTLAKLAAEIAKQRSEYQGTFSFLDITAQEKTAILTTIPIEDIWGVGWRLAPKLRAAGLNTSYSLANIRPPHAQQLMGIRGRQTVAELNGVSCFGLTPEHTPAKSIMRSRTFGEDTNSQEALQSAIATLGAQAAFRLRRDHLLAQNIGFFTTTSRHKPGYRRWVRELKLTQPTNDTGDIISRLIDELAHIHSSQQQYHRLGVFLYNLVPETNLQTDLLGKVNLNKHQRDGARMLALDHINDKWGRGKIHYATEHLDQTWRARRHSRSPRYVSNWNELPIAHITKNL